MMEAIIIYWVFLGGPKPYQLSQREHEQGIPFKREQIDIVKT